MVWPSLPSQSAYLSRTVAASPHTHLSQLTCQPHHTTVDTPHFSQFCAFAYACPFVTRRKPFSTSCPSPSLTCSLCLGQALQDLHPILPQDCSVSLSTHPPTLPVLVPPLKQQVQNRKCIFHQLAKY